MMTLFVSALALNHDQASSLVDKAMNVLGGRAKLASIRQISGTIASHDNLVEQSERPTGPYVQVYSRGTRTYDFDALTEQSELTVSGLVYGPKEVKRALTSQKGMTPFERSRSYLRMALGPERALLLAAQAPDLSLSKDVVFNGMTHRVVQFKWGSVPVRIFLKVGSFAPSGVESVLPLPFPWSVWGDSVITTKWGNWSMLDGGFLEPSQFTTEINGYPVSDETWLDAKVATGQGAAHLASPPATAKFDASPMLARYAKVEIAEGMTQFQGPFNTFVVDQPDGLVVIEPVFTPEFASAFLDRLGKEFPGKRIKAVVATDDVWPHFGGLRTFVSRGAELVILNTNRPIAQRFCDATFLTYPDELALHGAKPKFRLVDKSLTVGSGPNRFLLYPVAGQGSERMMMAYFPERKLLYGSDLLQKVGNGFFFPAYPKELVEAVTRERLDVTTVFAEHLGPTPWKAVTDFVKNL